MDTAPKASGCILGGTQEFQREEPGKQRPRSCRAQELSRSRAQGKGWRKWEQASNHQAVAATGEKGHGVASSAARKHPMLWHDTQSKRQRMWLSPWGFCFQGERLLTGGTRRLRAGTGKAEPRRRQTQELARSSGRENERQKKVDLLESIKLAGVADACSASMWRNCRRSDAFQSVPRRSAFRTSDTLVASGLGRTGVHFSAVKLGVSTAKIAK